ncbi:MAG: helix-turn-helix domain-containing protein [Oscillospiraceae bacterium]|nr:helix-turn-helix domain-containing protein [Oscillospiraceae bacterium]
MITLWASEMWGVKDVMAYLGVGRATATRILHMRGCPTLPREKFGSYRVRKEAFIRWWTEQR